MLDPYTYYINSLYEHVLETYKERDVNRPCPTIKNETSRQVLTNSSEIGHCSSLSQIQLCFRSTDLHNHCNVNRCRPPFTEKIKTPFILIPRVIVYPGSCFSIPTPWLTCLRIAHINVYSFRKR